MREFSLDVLNAMYGQQTTEVVIGLVTITHPSWSAPIRMSSDRTEVVSYEPLTYRTVSSGNTYWWVPFFMTLPDDTEDQAPACYMSVENVSRDLIVPFRTLDQRLGKPKLAIDLVLASDPDIIIVPYPDFDVQVGTANQTLVTLEMRIDDMVDEPWPCHTYGPANFPGLHGLTN